MSYQQVALSPGGELTANVYSWSQSLGSAEGSRHDHETGGVAVSQNTFAGRKPYRCVVDPLN